MKILSKASGKLRKSSHEVEQARGVASWHRERASLALRRVWPAFVHKAIVVFAAHGVTIGATERQGRYQDFIDHNQRGPHAAL